VSKRPEDWRGKERTKCADHGVLCAWQDVDSSPIFLFAGRYYRLRCK
jgi:hypothetical protein